MDEPADTATPEEISPTGAELSAGPPMIHSHLAYFFIPLPEPVGLPDRYVIRPTAPTPADRYRSSEDDERWSPPPPQHAAGSLMFHRATCRSPETDPVNVLFDVARVALPDPTEARAAHGASADPRHDPAGAPDAVGGAVPAVSEMTVVEVAVAFNLAGGDNTDDHEAAFRTAEGSIADAFDLGLQYVREAQRAYYIARRRPIRLVTRQALPFAVPFALGRLSGERGEPLPCRGALSMYMLNMNIVARDPDLDPAELRMFGNGLRAQAHNGVFTSSLEFVREADVALNVDGNIRVAVLFSATACEVLLDDLLAHMLWEEGQRPEQAAPVFDSRLTSRVKSRYHPRLGGNWSPDTPGPIRRWFRDVAGLRNRVTHGGYEPSLDEAYRARHTVQQLETHLADLVADKATTYPRTALVLPGVDGLRRRGVRMQPLERLQNDPDEVLWIETFARWQQAMQQARADSSVYIEPSAREARVCLVLRADGTEQWVVHDQTAAMAAATDPGAVKGVTPSARGELDRAVEALRVGRPHGDMSFHVIGASAAELPAGAWLPEYRLVPLTGVMVNGNDLDPA